MFLSDLGGIYGFTLGISIISILELFDFILLKVFDFILFKFFDLILLKVFDLILYL